MNTTTISAASIFSPTPRVRAGRRWFNLLMAAFSVSALSLASSAMAAYDPLSGKISLGGNHACAVTTSSGVKCWGDNAYGQLGDGTTAGRATPADVSGLTTGGASVTAGLRHSCALTASGGAKCWGWNVAGQLGDGTTTDRLVPTDVSGLTGGVASVVAGGVFTCALTTVGGLKCWGIGGNGQLGNGTTATRLVPTDVTGLTSGVSAVIAGAGHTCALTTAGGVKCWGLNSQGELGDGTGANQTVPVDVSGLASGIKGIGTSEQSNTTCAVTVAGGVKCWGDNRFSKLGDGTTNDSTVPLDVPGLPSVAAIAVGTLHVCALTTAGGVKCWGYNANGELGDGTVTTRSSPTDVIGLTGTVAAIYAGNSTSCALMTSGDVYCWGFNDRGQLGDGTTANRTTPVTAAGQTVEVFAGGENNIALFALEPRSGQPRLVDHYDTRGFEPRTFSIEPSGRFLIVANQSERQVVAASGAPRTVPRSVVVFEIGAGGKLEYRWEYAFTGGELFWIGSVRLPG